MLRQGICELTKLNSIVNGGSTMKNLGLSKINTLVPLLFSLIILMMLGVGGLFYSLNITIQDIYQQSNTIANIRDNLMEATQEGNNFLKSDDEEYINTVKSYIFEMSDLVIEAQSFSDSPEMDGYLESIQVNIDEYLSKFNYFVTILEYQDESTSFSDKIVPYATAIKENVNLAKEYTRIELETVLKKSLQLTLISISFIVLISILFTFLLRRTIGKSTRELEQKMKNATQQGDLTTVIHIKQKNEFFVIGTAINTFFQRLREIVLVVNRSSEDIFEHSAIIEEQLEALDVDIMDMSDTLNTISAGTQQTSASSQEINARIEEIASSLQLIAEDIRIGLSKALAIEQRAEKLGHEVATKIDYAQQIYKKTRRGLELSLEKSQEVQKINALTQLILDISDQTGLLSLNAAIEAARAGESGKGFAVVASEIRKLADTSTKSASEIQHVSETIVETVHTMSEEIEEILTFFDQNVMDDYRNMYDVSQQYTSDANVFKERFTTIDHTFKEVNEATVELSKSIEDIAKAISQNAIGIVELSEKGDKIGEESKIIRSSKEDSNNSIRALREKITMFQV